MYPTKPSEILPFLKQSPVSHGLAIRTAGIFLAFIQALLLARLAPPDVYGAYSVGMSLATLLAVVACLGLPPLSVREIPRLLVAQGKQQLPAFLRKTSLMVFSAATAIATITITAAIQLTSPDSQIIRQSIIAASLIIPLLAFLQLNSARLRGFSSPGLSQIVQVLSRPAFFVAALLITFFLDMPLTIVLLFSLSAAVTLLSALIASIHVHRKRHRAADKAVTGQGRLPDLSAPVARAALPFLLSSLAIVALTEMPMLILGALSGATEAGLLQPVLRIGLVIGIGHAVVAHPLGPRISKLWHVKDNDEMQRAAINGAKKSLVLTAPLAIACILLGETILSIFGERFVQSAPGLAAIAVAQLIVSMTGFAGLLLGMTSYQYLATINHAIAVVLVSLITALLVIPLGANGAAYAVAITLVITHLMHMKRCRSRMSIDSSIFFRNRH